MQFDTEAAQIASYRVTSKKTFILIPVALKTTKYEIQKPSTSRAAVHRCMFKFWLNVSRFSPCVINLSRNKNICCDLKKAIMLQKVERGRNLSNKLVHVARQLEGLFIPYSATPT